MPIINRKSAVILFLTVVLLLSCAHSLYFQKNVDYSSEMSNNISKREAVNIIHSSGMSVPGKSDCYGDPLPAGAWMRLGTSRLFHSPSVTSISISHDMKHLATGSSTGSIHILGILDGSLVRSIDGHMGTITRLVYGEDNKHLLSAGQDGKAVLWDTESGLPIMKFLGHKNSISSAGYSSNARLVVTASACVPNVLLDCSNADLQHKERCSDRTLRIWDAISGKELDRFESKSSIGFMDLAIANDGRHVAFCDNNGSTGIITLAPAGKIETIEHAVFRSKNVDFSSDGARVIARSGQWEYVWNYSNGNILKLLTKKHCCIGRECSGSIALTGTDKFLVSCDVGDENLNDTKRRRTIFSRIELESGRLVGSVFGFPGEVLSLDISQDASIAAIGDQYGMVSIWNLDKDKNETIVDYGQARRIVELSFSPNGEYLVSSDSLGRLLLWDMKHLCQSGRLLAKSGWPLRFGFVNNNTVLTSTSSAFKEIKLDSEKVAVVSSNTSVYSVANNREGTQIAIGMGKGKIRILSIENEGESSRLFEVPNVVLSIDYSEDGKSILVSGGGPEIFLLDVESGKVLKVINTKTRVVYQAIIRENSAIVTVGDSIVFYDLNTGLEVKKLSGSSRVFFSLDLSPDGSLLAAGGEAGRIIIWDTNTNEPVQSFKANDSTIRSLRFSPDGSFLASAGTSPEVVIWNISKTDAN